MLRTCNALRIASVPVLRNDGAGFALAPERGAGRGRAGLKPAPTFPATPVPPRRAYPATHVQTLVSDI
ncbi:MAG: hypothetical protein LBM98_08820 [Oscillospiraceae bacterium]|nr:hypothetical protein [Oscillospiraceae bacterium]